MRTLKTYLVTPATVLSFLHIPPNTIFSLGPRLARPPPDRVARQQQQCRDDIFHPNSSNDYEPAACDATNRTAARLNTMRSLSIQLCVVIFGVSRRQRAGRVRGGIGRLNRAPHHTLKAAEAASDRDVVKIEIRNLRDRVGMHTPLWRGVW